MFSTKHTRDTAAPQSYWQHMRVALWGSSRLIGYGLGGIWHAFFPEHKRFQFWTSSGIIGIFEELLKSGRHDKDMGDVLGLFMDADLQRFPDILIDIDYEMNYRLPKVTRHTTDD